jgi:hypothetical protein
MGRRLDLEQNLTFSKGRYEYLIGSSVYTGMSLPQNYPLVGQAPNFFTNQEIWVLVELD